MRPTLLLLIYYTLSGSVSWAQIEKPSCDTMMNEPSTLIAFSDASRMEERSRAIYETLLKRFGPLDPRRYASGMISEPAQQALKLYSQILAGIASRAETLNRSRSASLPCTKTLVRQALMRNPETLLEPWCENIVTSLVKASKSARLQTELEKLAGIALKLEAAEIVPFMNRLVDLTRGAFTAEEVLEDRLKRLILENKQISSKEDVMIPSLAYQLKTSYGQRLKWASPLQDDELFSFYQAFPSGFVQTYRTGSMGSLIRHLQHATQAVVDLPMPIVSRFSRRSQGFVWSRIRVIKLRGGSLPALHGYELKLLQQAIIPRYASPKVQRQAFLAIARPVDRSDFVSD